MSDEDILEASKDIPMLPDERRKIYVERGISKLNTQKVINHREMSDFLNTYIDSDLDFVIASNLLLGDIASYLNKTNKALKDTALSHDKFSDLVLKLSTKKLVSKNVKDLINDIMETTDTIDQLIEKHHIENITDDSVILEIIDEVIKENPDSVVDYHNGHDRCIKFLMGQVMKKSKGKADPKTAMELLIQKL